MTGTTHTTGKNTAPKWNADIQFSKDAWDYMWTAFMNVPGEVGMFGYVQAVDGGLFVVDDVFIVPQIASAAEVDFVEDGLPFAVLKAVEDERLDDLRFCAHSHGEMGTFWSGTDEEMIVEKMGSTGVDWFISVVGNRKGSVRGRLDVYDCGPFSDHLKADELHVFCEDNTNDELLARVKADLEQHVKAPKPITYSGGWNGKQHKPGDKTPGKELAVVTAGDLLTTADFQAWGHELSGLDDIDLCNFLYELPDWETVVLTCIMDLGWSMIEVASTKIITDDNDLVRVEVYGDGASDNWLTWTAKDARHQHDGIRKAIMMGDEHDDKEVAELIKDLEFSADLFPFEPDPDLLSAIAEATRITELVVEGTAHEYTEGVG